MSLWPLCRVWNTTDLLCTRILDTDTGQEEEEYMSTKTDLIFLPLFYLLFIKNLVASPTLYIYTQH